MALLRKKRSRQERGVIAIIGAFALAFVVILGLGLTELGFNVVHRFEAHNSAEAVALAGGLVVLSEPATKWAATEVPVGTLVPGNSRSTETMEAFSFVPVPNIVNGPSAPQDAPGILASQVAGPLQNFGSLLTQPSSVGGSASSAVYQYQVNSLVPVLSRVVLVLDYSQSMRLYFSGYTEDSGSALTVLHQAVHAAITAPNLNNPPRVNWGLVEYGGQVYANSVTPMPVTPAKNYLTATDVAQQTARIESQLRNSTQKGMSDMADAIDTARAMLDQMGQATPNNPYLGRGVILIITDGEPDYVPGVTDDSPSTYNARVTEAEANARASIAKAWNESNYQTLALTVLTNNAGPPPQSLTDFMGSITGNSDGKKQAEPQYAYVANKPSDVASWLSSINPATHCLSQKPMALDNNPWMNYPGTADNIYGYFVNGGAARDQEQETIRAHDPNNMDPPFINNQWTSQEGQFYWNSKYRLVELNVTLCLKYINQQNTNPPPLFRLRWGVPRVYQTAKLQTGG